MPIFNGRHCWKKFLAWCVAVGVIFAVTIYVTWLRSGDLQSGLLITVPILLLETVVFWYLVDTYGTRIFLASGFIMNEEEADKYCAQVIDLEDFKTANIPQRTD